MWQKAAGGQRRFIHAMEKIIVGRRESTKNRKCDVLVYA